MCHLVIFQNWNARKEVSSELLASVCHALGASVADVLIEAAGSMALQAAQEDLARV